MVVSYKFIYMIPKIIHYCWLSNNKIDDIFLNKWKILLTDYKFIHWDINSIENVTSKWLTDTTNHKYFAFASDYIRCYALYNYGGIYLDLDVELIKSFDDLLDQSFFIGYEHSGDIEAAVIGSEPGNEVFKSVLSFYDGTLFFNSKKNTFYTKPLPLILQKYLKSNLKIYSYDYFSPKNKINNTINITNNTYCVHHFNANWVKNNLFNKLKLFIHFFLFNVLNENNYFFTIKIIRKLTKK